MDALRRGVRSTKIHVTLDALGNPTGRHLTAGQASDLDGADALLDTLVADTLIADKGYDADQRVLAKLEQAGKTAVIPPKANRNEQRDYDKTARNFLAAIYFASVLIWLV